jgi:hypothetical protein
VTAGWRDLIAPPPCLCGACQELARALDADLEARAIVRAAAEKVADAARRVDARHHLTSGCNGRRDGI